MKKNHGKRFFARVFLNYIKQNAQYEKRGHWKPVLVNDTRFAKFLILKAVAEWLFITIINILMFMKEHVTLMYDTRWGYGYKYYVLRILRICFER